MAAAICWKFVMTWLRPDVLTGVASSTITVAMLNQPIARHHVSGEWLVPGTTHDCAAAASKACHSRPLPRLRCLK